MVNCGEEFKIEFDGKIVYKKKDDKLIPMWHGTTEDGLEKFVRDWAEKKWSGLADCIICKNGEEIETVGKYAERVGIEI